jgi:uncharacterized membrane protein required for colicin V production
MKTPTKRGIRLIVAVIIALTFSGVLLALIFLSIPESNSDILKVLVGFLGGAFITMTSFYFGDSDNVPEIVDKNV